MHSQKVKHLDLQQQQFRKAYLIRKEISHLDTLIYLIQVGGDQLLQEKHLVLNLKVNGESHLISFKKLKNL